VVDATDPTFPDRDVLGATGGPGLRRIGLAVTDSRASSLILPQHHNDVVCLQNDNCYDNDNDSKNSYRKIIKNVNMTRTTKR